MSDFNVDENESFFNVDENESFFNVDENGRSMAKRLWRTIS